MPLKSRNWSLTGRALDRLVAALANDPEAAGAAYGVLRQRLVGFFERRAIPDAEVLADETLDRIAHRLEQGERIEQVNGYAYGVARLVSMEWLRRQAREGAAQRLWPAESRDADEGEAERVRGLERCLEELPEESRRLILEYYGCRLEERKALAHRLGLTYTNLKTRAHRIRVVLQRCADRRLRPGEP
jgi:DNA-directed RNA polymerase specialized sigma24 family protein